MADITLVPIGVVRNDVAGAKDDVWDNVVSRIELDAAQFPSDSVAGLEEFSHVEVIFRFHLVAEGEMVFGARHPRGLQKWPKVGILAQRGRSRPNRIGATVCRLLGVDGLAVTVEGLDAVNGTPVLDIKPYLQEFGPRGSVRQPAWASELMSGYWRRA
jgi:tRNA-Thr(GGU) m(6)t(6)A37 methyltransferase TsaA